MANIYCGANELPKGKVYGTMKQCAERNQIRRFGIYRVDKSLVDNTNSKTLKNLQKMSDRTLKEVGLASGRIRYIKRELPYIKNAKEKEALREEGKKLIPVLKEARSKYEELQKKIKKIETDMVNENKQIYKETLKMVKERSDAQVKRHDEAVKRKELALQRKEASIKKKQELAEKKENILRRKEEANRKKQEALKRKEEAARKKEEAARKKEEAAKKKEEAARKKEEAKQAKLNAPKPAPKRKTVTKAPAKKSAKQIVMEGQLIKKKQLLKEHIDKMYNFEYPPSITNRPTKQKYYEDLLEATYPELVKIVNKAVEANKKPVTQTPIKQTPIKQTPITQKNYFENIDIEPTKQDKIKMDLINKYIDKLYVFNELDREPNYDKNKYAQHLFNKYSIKDLNEEIENYKDYKGTKREMADNVIKRYENQVIKKMQKRPEDRYQVSGLIKSLTKK